MSEHFEKEVKQILDDIRLEPRSAVWNQVREAIQPRKRPGRFIFWWILPLALSAGLVTYMLNDTSITNLADNKNEASSKTKARENNEVLVTTSTVKDENIGRKPGKQSTSTVIISLNKAFSRFTGKNRKERWNGKQQQNIVSQATRENQGKIQANSNDQSPKTVISAKNKNNIPIDTASENMVAKKRLTATVQQTAKATDTSVALTQEAIREISGKKSKWSFGITAEAGITIAAEAGLFNLGQRSTPEIYAISSISPSVPPLAAPTAFRQTTSAARKSFGLYVTARRELSNIVSFQSALGYRYQSFSITTSVMKDSVVSGSLGTYPMNRISSDYQLHYIDFSAGLTLKLLEVNDFQFGIGAAINNQFVLKSRQSTRNEHLLSNPFTLYTKNNSPDQFNRWQPMLRLQLTASFNQRQKQWLQLSPYYNYGMRTFEKNPSTSKTHVSSFGLAATYFFR